MTKTSCPQCGYLNHDKALVCNLCKAILKREAKRAEKIVRKVEARSSFYAERNRNRRNSNILLISLMTLLMLLGATIGRAYDADPLVGAGFAFIIAAILGGGTWFSGSSLILSMSGAYRITHDDHPQLFNVVEEMKIASGLPMPAVYIIESSSPNAFATGRDPKHSAVAVTRGLLKKLNRNELQGVIAHEFSHIKNLDIRYAMLVSVLVGTTALIADAFLRGFRRIRRSHPVLLVVAVIFALLAPISAKIVQMAISRGREFLADASAVELTRNPEGLASALAKIVLDPEPLETSNRATQHLYIVNPIKSFSMNSSALFSTHPPTEARIKRLQAMGAIGGKM